MLLLILTGTIIFVIVSYKVYQKLTCGICKSGAHMVGKVVLITGGNSGIGYETAKNLAERGAKVIIACRNVRLGVEAKDEIIRTTGNNGVYFQQMDLSSFKSVRKFCDDIIRTEKKLDVLINNAGAGALGNYKSEDGNHIGVQVNYFGPFLLTNLLLPLLKSSSPSRIVNVSSTMHIYGEIDFNNLNMEKYWSEYQVYANSKMYLNLMTVELSRRLKGTGVTVNALHPGISATNLFRNLKYKIVRTVFNFVLGLIYQSVWEASQTSIYLAVSPEVKDVTGKYFSDCAEAKATKTSMDPEIAKRLWQETEKIVDVFETKMK